jgi:hypothetical protein
MWVFYACVGFTNFPNPKRMRQLIFIVILLTSVSAVKASHIVGGEFEMKYLGSYQYSLSLIWYFDEANNPGRIPEDQEPVITVSIFRKWDNVRMMNVTLIFKSPRTDVRYANEGCSEKIIATDKLVYASHENFPVYLNPNIFNHPQGYYIAWERCCRNYTIDNIYSENPQVSTTNFAGQTFYMEFPPVIKDGVPFINSSPYNFFPVSDYACPYIPYAVDFSGIDDDGDSLAYSMITPLNTFTADALPPFDNLARPGPYPFVQWKPGFGINNIVDGVTNLEITKSGILIVTPKTSGLFAFAIRVEEFRNGVKIGEVRRDFQLLVKQTGGCPIPDTGPKIEGKLPGEDIFNEKELVIFYPYTTPLEDRCFTVKISDPSTELIEEGNIEEIKIKAVALDFNKNVNEILPSVKSDIIVNGEEAFFEICFRDICPYTKDGTFTIGIIAEDGSCPTPLKDTLYVKVTVEYPPNSKVQFNNQSGLTEYTATLGAEDLPESWDLRVDDADGDVIEYKLIPVEFDLTDAGMSFSLPYEGQQVAPLTPTLTWNPSCDIIERINKTNFVLYFIADDKDVCSVNPADTTVFNLTIDIPENEPPVLTIESDNINQPLVEGAINAVLGDPITLVLTGIDPDTAPVDVLTITLTHKTGTVEPTGYVFESKSGTGPLQTTFTWKPNCSIFKNNAFENDYTFTFRLTDNKCFNEKDDALSINIKIVDVDGTNRDFLPPNIFTPNGDGKNDFFAMVRENESGELVEILPKDNCLGEFVSFSVYNRWGKQVYQTVNRDFRWYGGDLPVGVYYYLIKYTNNQYKGLVTIRY